MERAVLTGMKNKCLLPILLLLLAPVCAAGRGQEPETNVNSRYEVESVQLSGVSKAKISKTLHEDMQKLVGEKYNQEATNTLAKRLRKELPEYSVSVKVKRGDKQNNLKVIFEAERTWWKRFDIPVPPVVTAPVACYPRRRLHKALWERPPCGSPSSALAISA